MNISYNWLKEFIDFDQTPEEIGEIFTQTGLEVESIKKIDKIPGNLEGIVVGEVIECDPHPNTDKLKVTKVDIGAETLSDIVCGAPNVATGQKVLVATVNSTIHPTNGEPFKIKKSKIRGEISTGMICSENEIGVGTSHDGIMVFDTDKPNGICATELFEFGEDYRIEIGLTPNRGDAVSHLGVARDLKAYFKKELVYPEASLFEVKSDRPIKVSVTDSSRCPRFTGVTIRGIKVAPSPDWLQWKLKVIGLEPINNIVDITNYVLFSIGQPMHAYDVAKVTDDEIIVKTLPYNTPFITLEGKERRLHKDDIMVCNSTDGMCIAGIMGGLESGIKNSTTAIFLESAYWSPDGIRSSAQYHTVSTDASFRYERGADPEMTLTAVKLAISLILDIAGGYVASDIIDIYPEKIVEKEIETTFHHFHRLIGKEIPRKEITDILNLLDIETADVTNEGFKAIVPTYRSDVTRPADLVEEVLRIYGFNEVELDDCFSSNYLAEFNKFEPYRVQEDLSKYLAGKGYAEIITNSLTNPDYYKKVSLGGDPVEILNKSSDELGILKTSPVYSTLDSIVYNINRRNLNLKLFELSKTYEKKGNEYEETEYMCIYLTGNTMEANWLEETRKVSFYDASTVMMSLLNYAGIRKNESNPLESDALFGYGLVLTKNDRELTKVGNIRKDVLNMYGIKQDVFYAQINWKHLLEAYKSDIAYEEIPKYPEVKRDLSLVIDETITYTEIQQLAFRQESRLLNRMSLFSIYKGEKIEKGKKAYAISFFLQDKYKTLANRQIDKSMNSLMNLYEKEIGAVIRK